MNGNIMRNYQLTSTVKNTGNAMFFNLHNSMRTISKYVINKKINKSTLKVKF